MTRRTTAAIAAMAAAMALPGCGYRVSGRADLLPKDVRTIAIPAFTNLTTRYKLAEHLPAALGREFIGRTRYEIVADPANADAVLNGAVISYNGYSTILDPATGRAAGVQVNVVLQLRLTERVSGKILFDRPGFEARQRYEVSVDGMAYFDESSAALDRLSKEVARSVVSAILENF